MASNCSQCALGDVLDSTPYTLAYALPLLLISFVLTFAGSFLTLDRTRIFAPRRNSVKSLPRSASELKRIESSLRWLSTFEGGVGGIAAGYVFSGGLFSGIFSRNCTERPTVSSSLGDIPCPAHPKRHHLCRTLSKVFPRDMAAVLTMLHVPRWAVEVCCSGPRRHIWIVSAFSHRECQCSSPCAVCSSTFGVACTVMIHPSLKARIVLVSIFTPIGLVLCLLPLARYQHAFLRVATSSAGAFGMVLSIAILADIPVWREVWSRLWIDDASGWGSSIEKGLSTVYCILLLLGCLCDWFLHRKLGENPDEVRTRALWFPPSA